MMDLLIPIYHLLIYDLLIDDLPIYDRRWIRIVWSSLRSFEIYCSIIPVRLAGRMNSQFRRTFVRFDRTNFYVRYAKMTALKMPVYRKTRYE
jgi:hypothetical protein